MLAFDDIQHILLTRALPLTGRYELLSAFNFHPHLPHDALTTDDTNVSMYWRSVNLEKPATM